MQAPSFLPPCAPPIVIIGAGQAGAALALHLREKGCTDPIVMLGEEAHPPYQRPPLSKKYLSGEWDAGRLALRDSAIWDKLGITLRLGARVSGLDPASRTVALDGQRLTYSRLALTTGATARPLPPEFAGKANVFELRTLADVDRLRPQMRPGARLAVLGGGFIGLETAAVAARAGLTVTVIERAPRILERAVGPATAAAIAALHAREGVRLLAGRAVVAVKGEAHIEALTLDDGTHLETDAVLAGIGVLPATGLAQQAGLALDNGIAVDSFARTSAPGIWAAGDCASFPYQARRLRLESVQNAIDQAKVAAEDMLGLARPYAPVPWFWSDQFDSKLQIAGLTHGADRVIARAGRGNGSAQWHYAGAQLVAVEALDDAAAFMTGKRLLEAGRSPDPARMEDPAFDPRSALA